MSPKYGALNVLSTKVPKTKNKLHFEGCLYFLIVLWVRSVGAPCERRNVFPAKIGQLYPIRAERWRREVRCWEHPKNLLNLDSPVFSKAKVSSVQWVRWLAKCICAPVGLHMSGVHLEPCPASQALWWEGPESARQPLLYTPQFRPNTRPGNTIYLNNLWCVLHNIWLL